MVSKSTWQRVSRRRPCPVCNKPDWCLYTGHEDAPAAVICARTESAKRIGDAGWLHVLRDGGPTWPSWRWTLRRAVRMISRPEAAALDFGRLAADAQAAVKPGALDRLAGDLGVSVKSLRWLRIGWLVDRRAWSFPMRDASGRVAGIRLRLPNGRKLSSRGGREGLLLPEALGPGGRLLITEGPTDTAAMLDLGFSPVGRPSCAGGARLLVELVRQHEPEEVVIVADGDTPGRDGADALAGRLAAFCPAVRVITPPPGIKDARAWKRAGATAGDVLAAIEAAQPRRLQVTTRRKGRTKCPRKTTV